MQHCNSCRLAINFSGFLIIGNESCKEFLFRPFWLPVLKWQETYLEIHKLVAVGRTM